MSDEPSPERALEIRGAVSRVQMRTSMVGLGLFLVSYWVFSLTVVSEDDYSDSIVIRVTHGCTAASFFTTAVNTLMAALFSPGLKSSDRTNHDHLQESQSVKMSIIFINGISCAAHFLIAIGASPVTRGFGDRIYHVARKAEWVGTIPIMMVLLHSYDVQRQANLVTLERNLRQRPPHSRMSWLEAIWSSIFRFRGKRDMSHHHHGHTATVVPGVPLGPVDDDDDDDSKNPVVPQNNEKMPPWVTPTTPPPPPPSTFSGWDVIGRSGIISVTSQTMSTTDGVIAGLYGGTRGVLPDWLAFCLVGIAFILYANIFWILSILFGESRQQGTFLKNLLTKSRRNTTTPKLHQNSDDEAPSTPPPPPVGGNPTVLNSRGFEFREWVAAYEQKLRTSRVNYLAMICAFLWTAIVLTFLLGLAEVMSNDVAILLFTGLDVASKGLYVTALGEATALAEARESAIRKLLELEQAATTQRRHFLRFVMHEVRVPLNAVKLGVATIAEAMANLLSFGSPNPPQRRLAPEDAPEKDTCDHTTSSSSSSRSLSSVPSVSERNSAGEINEIINVVDRSIDVMSETLNDVLSFAAIEEGRFELHCSQFRVKDMLSVVLATHSPMAREKGIALTSKIDDILSDVVLYGDHRRISACISNYVSNALKFSKAGDPSARVTVVATGLKELDPTCCWNIYPTENDSPKTPGKKIVLDPPKVTDHHDPTSSDDDAASDRSSMSPPEVISLCVSVADNGHGIAKDDQSRLFQAFSQIRPGELQEGRGSGLGLAISREVIERHGGEIGMESELNVGSTFHLRVPLSVVPKMTSPEPVFQGAKKKGTMKRQKAGKMRVLIVDDVPSNRKLFAMQVKRLGFRIQEAENGKVAVDICGYGTTTNVDFDVIFMDSVMPVMSGLEATTALRAAGCRSLIIGVTGNALEEDVRAFVDAGANAVLTKPVSRKQLEAKLAEFDLLPETTDRSSGSTRTTTSLVKRKLPPLATKISTTSTTTSRDSDSGNARNILG